MDISPAAYLAMIDAYLATLDQSPCTEHDLELVAYAYDEGCRGAGDRAYQIEANRLDAIQANQIGFASRD